MEKILVLDDDLLQLENIKNILKDDFLCDTFSNPIQALKKIENEDYDCVITDLHMPIINGIDFIKKLRIKKDLHLPVLVFSNDYSLPSKVSCLELNIHDYLYSSMDAKEISLRIKNAVSRKKKLCFKDLMIDEESMQVKIGKQNLEVTQIEYKILFKLLKSDYYLSKKELFNFIWPNSKVVEKTINTHMTNLRAKLKPFGITIVTSHDENVILTSFSN